MANLIELIIDGLQEVNHTIESKTKAEEVTFGDAFLIAHFYSDFKDTNKFIDEVEESAHRNLKALIADATELRGEINKFLSLDLTMWKNLDFEDIGENHLKIYQERCDKDRSVSTALWKKYQSESNRLDFMDMFSEEFRALDVQCCNTKVEYDKAHEITDRSYEIMKSEQEKCAHVHYFEMQFLELWATKMMQITEAVREDAKRLLKEG